MVKLSVSCHLLDVAREIGGGGGSGQVLRNFRGRVMVGVIICYMGGGGGQKMAIMALHNLWMAPKLFSVLLSRR